MASNHAREERVQALVAAMLAEEEAEGGDWRKENINDIEDAMVRIGDLVAREVGVQKLERHTSHASEPQRCPECGETGEFVEQKARDLITRRGKVPLTEGKYRCPKCRRHFFPSDHGVGD